VTYVIKLYILFWQSGWSSTMRVGAGRRMLQLLQVVAVFFFNCNIGEAASGGASRDFVTLVTLVTAEVKLNLDALRCLYVGSSVRFAGVKEKEGESVLLFIMSDAPNGV